MSRRFAPLLALLTVSTLLHSAAAGIVDVHVEETHAVSPTAKITVRNTDGRIMVYGSDEPEVRIHALKRAFSQDRAEAIKVKVTLDGDAVVIDTEYPPPSKGVLVDDRSGTVDYTILVPEGATLSKVELANGELLIEGMRGPRIEAQVTRGKLVVRNCFSELSASASAAGIDLFYGWWEEAAFGVRAITNRGDIRLALPAAVACRIDAATADGHIDNTLAAEPQSESHALVTAIGETPTADFNLRADSGNIRVGKSY